MSFASLAESVKETHSGLEGVFLSVLRTHCVIVMAPQTSVDL